MSGHCSEHTPQESNDFAEKTADLDGVVSGADDIKNNPSSMVPRAFGGSPEFCAFTTAGFKNCCADKGWGKDIGLAHCSDEEKALGKAKESGLAIKIGTYCAHYVKALVVKHCTSHHTVYCVFRSKMAKDVQQQGRLEQLGRGFGSPQLPDCSGLSPTELQRLNFNSMNLDDVYDDIKNGSRFPKGSDSESSIEQKIIDHYQERKKDG